MSSYQAEDFANWLVNHADREAGEVVTHLKLQKLLYFAQAYHLANFNKSLFEEDFQAWTHGPVVPEVWNKFKKYSYEAIPPRSKVPKFSDEAALQNYMRAVIDKFGSIGAKRLEKITHEHAPWRDARGNLPEEHACSNVIPKLSMRDFYAARIKKDWGERPIG